MVSLAVIISLLGKVEEALSSTGGASSISDR
jgi:hypothetical protein